MDLPPPDSVKPVTCAPAALSTRKPITLPESSASAVDVRICPPGGAMLAITVSVSVGSTRMTSCGAIVAGSATATPNSTCSRPGWSVSVRDSLAVAVPESDSSSTSALSSRLATAGHFTAQHRLQDDLAARDVWPRRDA